MGISLRRLQVTFCHLFDLFFFSIISLSILLIFFSFFSFYENRSVDKEKDGMVECLGLIVVRERCSFGNIEGCIRPPFPY